MNPWHVGAAAGLLTSGGLWCAALSVRRAPRSLAAARVQLHGVGRSMSGAAHAGSTRRDQLVRAVAAAGPGRWAVRRFGDGLEVAGLSPIEVIGRLVVVSGGTFFAALGVLSASTAIGVLPVSLLSPMAAALTAVLAGCFVVYDIRAKVERGRREMRRVANDFVQLVAVGLTTDQSVEEAIRFALEVGHSDAADPLRAALHAAPQRGVAVWDALDEVGMRLGIRELTELAASVERQGTQGVAIRDTVETLAASMRSRALDELEREADLANANLSGPTIGFVVATVVFLAYPLVHRVNEAFGG
ncbi:MAG: hypothetical protein Q8M22_08735 [Actinomycetota bacterium]|nr:hypothetical protein [Actinomycetota bacterium]